MSGGSYNYVYCYLEEGALELLERKDDVQAMYQRLCELEYAQLAAQETNSVLADLEQLQQTIAQLDRKLRNPNLAKVWKAVEWWDSRDIYEQDVLDAIAEFQAAD